MMAAAGPAGAAPAKQRHELDAATLARIQFGFTAGFHFLFPPLTIGTAWIIFFMMTRYRSTGDEVYGRMVRFWLKLFAITFAIGVATGITLEFQFGMNWSEYSRYVGDIFGAPLAAEGIFAFFLESTFVGVLLFGWNRVSKKTLWISSLMVAVGSTLSAFWIIVANSWQQTPTGYQMIDGRAELADFAQAVFNPSTLPRYFHTVDAAIITGAFFVMGVSAWYLLERRHVEVARRSFRISLVTGLVASLLALGLGHWHAVQVAETQPAKLAAFEGLFETQKGAPALVFGIPDREAKTVHAAIEIPKGLSLLAFLDPDAEVKGLDAFPEDEWPPLLSTFFSFHLMVALGTIFILFTVVAVLLMWKGKLFEGPWHDKIMKAAIVLAPMPLLVNELGWVTAEMGRQPWIVYGLLKTKDAVSVAVPAWQVLASLIVFVVVYGLLGVLWVFLLKDAIRRGPEPEPAEEV